MSVPLERINEYTWRIPQSYKPGMRVPGMVFADDELLGKMRTDRTLVQCVQQTTRKESSVQEASDTT